MRNPPHAQRAGKDARPSWAFTAQGRHDLKEMQTARELFAQFNGVPLAQVHLDHVYPINGETVSGLHCADNLQPMLASRNRAKRNYVLPETEPAYRRVTWQVLRGEA